MINVFVLQWKRLFKQPFLILMFIGLTFLFVYFMGGVQGSQSMNVQVFSEDLSEEEVTAWIDRLNDDEAIEFELSDAETVEEDIRMNELGFALEIEDWGYSYLAGREDDQMGVVDQHVNRVFREYYRLEEVRAEFPDTEVEIQEFLSVHTSAATATASQVNGIFVLIGMTFYFSVYSILYLQMNLLDEKRKGTWNRLIFSPVSKTQLYLGNLFHYYLVGLAQILLSFVISTQVLGFDLGNNYFSIGAITLAFTFAIVSLGILLIGLVPSPQSLQAVIPIVATAMAMIGGAFWPLEIISNRALLFLAELMPIRHGLYGILDAILQERPVTELMQPIGALVLMGIVFMGIGINLMERVSEH